VQKVFIPVKSSSSDKTTEITAVPISRKASDATTAYGRRNSTLILTTSFFE
jgi:hypothetical protein